MQLSQRPQCPGEESPDKKIFHSRKAALQHMMQAGTYDPDDIVKMTKGLNVLLNVGDEWKEGKEMEKRKDTERKDYKQGVA